MCFINLFNYASITEDRTMNWSLRLIEAVRKQGFDMALDEVMINIFTIAGDVFYGCFIEDESHDSLSIVETNVRGNEEIRILNKNEVSHISVIYQSMENNEKREEVMYR